MFLARILVIIAVFSLINGPNAIFGAQAPEKPARWEKVPTAAEKSRAKAKSHRGIAAPAATNKQIKAAKAELSRLAHEYAKIQADHDELGRCLPTIGLVYRAAAPDATGPDSASGWGLVTDYTRATEVPYRARLTEISSASRTFTAAVMTALATLQAARAISDTEQIHWQLQLKTAQATQTRAAYLSTAPIAVRKSYDLAEIVAQIKDPVLWHPTPGLAKKVRLATTPVCHY